MRRAIGAAIAALAVGFLTTPAAALCGNGAASEDLTNECLVTAFEHARSPTDRQALGPVVAKRLSYAGNDRAVGLPRATAQPPLRFSIRPVLEWSTNLNGGQSDRTFFVAGFPLTFREEDQRRAGFAAGAEVAASKRLLLGNGHRLDLSTAVSAAHAPEEDVNIIRGQIGGCHSWRINQAQLLGSCLIALRTDRDLARSDAVLQSVTATRFLRMGAATTGLQLNLERRLEHNLDQRSLRVGVEAILPGDRVAQAEFGGGQFGQGEFGVSQSLNLSLASPMMGRAARVRYSRSRQDGATLFSQARVDRNQGLQIDVHVSKRASIQLGYVHRDSTSDTFDESYPTIGLRLSAFDF